MFGSFASFKLCLDHCTTRKVLVKRRNQTWPSVSIIKNVIHFLPDFLHMSPILLQMKPYLPELQVRRWSEFQHSSGWHLHIYQRLVQIVCFLFLQHQVLQTMMQPKWSWIHHMLPHQMSLQPWCQSHSVFQLKREQPRKVKAKQVLWTDFNCKFSGATRHLPQQSSLFVSVTSDTATASSRSTTSHPGSNTFGSVWLQVFWFQIGLASPSTAPEAAPPPGLVVLWKAGLPSARLQPGRTHWVWILSFW